MTLLVQTTQLLNELLIYGLNHYGVFFFALLPLIYYSFKLLNENVLESIRFRITMRLNIPPKNLILTESKHSILEEIENITYQDSINKTKILRMLCYMIIDKTYTISENKELKTSDILIEYTKVKEEFKLWLIEIYGESGHELYDYIMPILSKDISVLLSALSTNLEMMRMQNLNNKYIIDTLIYSYLKSILKKFEFGFYQFNGKIDNIINK